MTGEVEKVIAERGSDLITLVYSDGGTQKIRVTELAIEYVYAGRNVHGRPLVAGWSLQMRTEAH